MTTRIPNKLQAWLAFGGLAQRLDQNALAERIVDEVVARFPGEPRVALLRASQLREAGKHDEARKVLAALEPALLLVPELRLAIAAEYDALGDSPAAAATLARGPQDDQTYALRASLLARAEDKTALTALYEELRTRCRQARSAAAPAAGADRGVPRALRRSAGLVPRRSRRRAALAGAAARRQRAARTQARRTRPTQALRELQADAAAPEDARRDAYLLEAELRNKDKNDAGELDAYARGLAAFPDDPDSSMRARWAGSAATTSPRAEADFRKILVADPDNTAALNALGYTLADRTTRYQEALELIDRARAAEPDNAAIIDSYGWVLYRLGRKEEALVELRRAFALQKDPEIAAHVGEVLWDLGKKDEARKYFDEARKLDPENRALQRALEKTGA